MASSRLIESIQANVAVAYRKMKDSEIRVVSQADDSSVLPTSLVPNAQSHDGSDMMDNHGGRKEFAFVHEFESYSISSGRKRGRGDQVDGRRERGQSDERGYGKKQRLYEGDSELTALPYPLTSSVDTRPITLTKSSDKPHNKKSNPVQSLPSYQEVLKRTTGLEDNCHCSILGIGASDFSGIYGLPLNNAKDCSHNDIVEDALPDGTQPAHMTNNGMQPVQEHMGDEIECHQSAFTNSTHSTANILQGNIPDHDGPNYTTLFAAVDGYIPDISSATIPAVLENYPSHIATLPASQNDIDKPVSEIVGTFCTGTASHIERRDETTQTIMEKRNEMTLTQTHKEKTDQTTQTYMELKESPNEVMITVAAKIDRMSNVIEANSAALIILANEIRRGLAKMTELNETVLDVKRRDVFIKEEPRD